MGYRYGAGYSASAATEKQLTAAAPEYLPATKRGCLVYHGAGGNALSPYSVPYGSGVPGTGLMQKLLDVGIPSMSADWASDSFGNDTAVNRSGDGFTFLTTAAAGHAQAASDKVLLAGFSMGALTALNWATRNLAKVAAIVLGLPLIDLEHAHDDGVAPVAMEAAYTNLAGLQAAYPTHSPINFAANLAGIPIGIWYGNPDTDNLIRPADVEAFAAAVGGSAVLHSLGSVPHNVNLISTTEMVDFLAPYA